MCALWRDFLSRDEQQAGDCLEKCLPVTFVGRYQDAWPEAKVSASGCR